MTASKTNTTCTAISTKRPLSLAAGDDIEFVELLARSNFSFLQGASHPEELVEQARKLGYRGMALCDLNGLYGTVKAYQAVAFPSHFVNSPCPPSGFDFYCGAEMQLQDKSSIALLPLNRYGYARLCQLITKCKRPAPKAFSSLTLEDVLAHNEDLLAFALPPWNESGLKRLREAFDDRLYLPVWKDLTWASIGLYNQALDLERRHGYTLFATQRPFMHHPDRKPLHDVLTCILHGTTLAQAKTRLLANRERHLKPLHELALIWKERPDLLAQTVQIAKRIEFSLDELKYQYPQSALPEGVNASDHLRRLSEDGLSWRFPLGVPEKVRATCEHELKVIHELAYEDYFLTLYDICQFARNRGILFQGRGSAANSVVCFALGLTAVDPTKIDLLFERFISKERGEPPDIDIDFDSARREEVIQYIYQKYGSEHAAMVSTVICYRSRMALRESAKVLAIPQATIDHMVKFMGRDGLKRLVENPAMSDEWGLTRQQFQLLMDISANLKGFPRHLGIHSGGFLISQRPITECVPIEKATMDQRYVIQWNKDDLTVLKMMKIDVLGLGMLGALQMCFELLQRHKGIRMDLAMIPADDKPTYEMVQQADTVGVFQIESRAQMSLLPRLRPETFYDLVVEVAIIRPGPIQGGMVHPYIRRRHGQEKVTYPHADLRPILGKTFGVPIFQEQIMQIASTVAGFTPGEADELRRIMSSSWKKAELMEGLRQRLINGMLAHGIQMSYAEQIYQTIVGFASYGFPESHAASFALLTYASCYLKRHHPDAFVCALLNSQPMGFYSPRALVGDAQRHGVQFLPLDIQRSEFDYQLECPSTFCHAPRGKKSTGTPVRAGLRAIHGLREKHLRAMLDERAANGPYKDLTDLVKRTNLPRVVLLKLAASGALSPLGLTPRQALWRIHSLELKSDSLFFAQPREQLAEDPDRGHLPNENSWEQMVRESSTQGFSLTHHPLGLLRPGLKSRSGRSDTNAGTRTADTFVRAADLRRLGHGRSVRIAGLLSLLQRPPTAKGFVFLSLEDESGMFNVVLTPKVYDQFRMVIAFNPLIEVRGRIESANGVINVKGDFIAALPIGDMLNALAPPLPAAGLI